MLLGDCAAALATAVQNPKLRLGWLAPDVVGAVLEGRQPPRLTRQRLARVAEIPIVRRTQEKLFWSETYGQSDGVKRFSKLGMT